MREMTQTSQLSMFELSELKQCEDVIERGLQTFLEVGNALLEIREKQLYRDHGTFEDYCKERWGWSRRRGIQLADAAEVVRNVNNSSHSLTHVPQNEAQVRPLTTLEPEEQAPAWEEACATAANGEPTAAEVQTVVDRFKERPERPKPERKPKPEPEPDPDDFGRDWIKWWEEQNLFLVSLPRRGGIVNLTRRWTETRRRAAVNVLRNLAATASQCADELERNLDGEAEDTEFDA